MGRSLGEHRIVNNLRDRRVAIGLSQQQLATRSGLSRQAVNAIESGRYVPNTAVGIRLARALRTTVEDLFTLPASLDECAVELTGEGWEAGTRLAVARVGERMVAHPLTGPRGIVEGFQPADAVSSAEEGVASLLVPPDLPDRTAFLFGCDPSLGALASRVAEAAPQCRLVWLHASSEAALEALPLGLAHAGGAHLPGHGSGDDNVARARLALGPGGGLIVTYASWEQGLIVAPGNPRSLRTVADLARPGVCFVNREAGSGSRRMLDDLLIAGGVQSSAIEGYSSAVLSHAAVARAVAAGGADAGVGLEAIARAFGLDFVPLSTVRFDIAIPSRHVSQPAIRAMLDVLQAAALRRDLASLPGYSTSQTGSVVARFPEAA